jgi:hypothetical protein
MKLKRFFVITLILATAASTFLFVTMAAVDNTITVTSTTPGGWTFSDDNGQGNGTGTFVSGPSTPPLGNGSARITLSANNAGWILSTSEYRGTRFADITQLQYSTYQADRVGTAVAISLQFTVDNDLTDTDTSFKGRLVFEPYLTGAVADDQWQTWNPMNGLWWGTGSNPATRPFGAACPQSNPCTWQQVLALFPQGGIHAVDPKAVVFKAGANWGDSFNGNVDAFTIGVNNNNTTYNFEAIAPTAASVSISGRVLTNSRRGLSNALVYLTDSEGNTRTARTNSFGYYRFQDVSAGQSVAITVVSKRYQFAPQVLNLNEEMNGVNFLADN